MIEIDSVTKKFNVKDKNGNKAVKTAIDNLSLTIADGELLGLLGPNGAGKTTLVSMLVALMCPTEGQIFYNGQNLAQHEQDVKKIIGIVPQHINFDQDLTVWENMELHGRLHRMPKDERRRRIDELLNYVGLSDRRNDNIKALSGGLKRRLLIVRALMHSPQVLFLDEPTVALDPQVRRKIWDLIRNLHRDGVTIVLTTHYIEEAEALCGRVAVMDSGRLIKTDTPQNLCHALGSFAVEWDGEKGRQYSFFAAHEEAKAFAGAKNGAFLRHTTLEDVFIELTGKAMN
ncbi:MAG: ABC transporter [Phascolarctobacterium sp.]|nr:MAG: ABC transporter [Phascolarctobacterium sp.]